MPRALGHRLLRHGWLGLCAFAGGATLTALASLGSAGATPSKDSPYAFLRQLARVLVVVEEEYVSPVDRDTLLEGALGGMLAQLDPHSAYLNAEEYKLFRADTEGEFGGIGVEVDFRDDLVTVIAPIEGSPAARAGIRSGDRIVSIDKVPVRGKSSTDLVQRMRGKPGTRVSVGVQRGDRDKVLFFTLTREIIAVSSVVEATLEGDIGYLRIKQFQAGTHTELLRAIAALRSQKGFALRGVVLDLRNNPGGLVDEAAAVADEFLRGGVIYTTRARGRTVDEVRANESGALRRGPLAILVNEYSASAAELVAGALQDHHRGTVVGSKTFGKGSVQSIITLPDGAGLRLTTMLYYTPSGRTIQARGIAPDVLVAAGYATDKTYEIVRESDLEGHIVPEDHRDEGSTTPSPEAPSQRRPPTPGHTPQTAPPTPQTSREEPPDLDNDARLGVSREIPRDPTGGKDVALSIGYQLVRTALRR